MRSIVGRLTVTKAFFVLMFAAFATRLLPLYLSQYPFNNDSLSECALASGIMTSGHLGVSIETPWYSTHAGATPIMNVVLAFISDVFGTTPLQCAQVLVAVISVLTVGCVFLLGRLFSGSFIGGFASAFAAVLMGTFAFTTGSAWKEMLGIALFVLTLYAYVGRDRIELRVLVFATLMVLPLVHHLVALVAVLTVAYLLCWSWFFAIVTRLPKRRCLEDTVVILIPIVWSGLYYSAISFDRVSLVSSPLKLVVFGVAFAMVCVLAIMVLSIKTHSKWTFAPAVGGGLLVVALLDYSGFFFSYTPSASDAYLFLILTSAFLLAIAWYGTEVIIENKPRYRAVQLALIVSPLSILGYGVMNGSSSLSFQIVYRTFDFADIFIFLGIAVAVAWLYEKRRRLYDVVGFFVIVSLLVSFPFAYESESLLGVRHDTQAYEVDSVSWLAGHSRSPVLQSDERLGHIAESTVGLLKHPGLPGALIRNVTVTTIPDTDICLVEDSWSTRGVNDFPAGEVVLPASNYTLALEAGNVIYIGGPATDRAVMFTLSSVGDWIVYGPPV